MTPGAPAGGAGGSPFQQGLSSVAKIPSHFLEPAASPESSGHSLSRRICRRTASWSMLWNGTVCFPLSFWKQLAMSRWFSRHTGRMAAGLSRDLCSFWGEETYGVPFFITRKCMQSISVVCAYSSCRLLTKTPQCCDKHTLVKEYHRLEEKYFNKDRPVTLWTPQPSGWAAPWKHEIMPYWRQVLKACETGNFWKHFLSSYAVRNWWNTLGNTQIETSISLVSFLCVITTELRVFCYPG